MEGFNGKGRGIYAEASRVRLFLLGVALLLLLAGITRSLLFTFARYWFWASTTMALELSLELSQFLNIAFLLMLVHGLVLFGFGGGTRLRFRLLLLLLKVLPELRSLNHFSVDSGISLHDYIVKLI
jgi:hypothetical protein